METSNNYVSKVDPYCNCTYAVSYSPQEGKMHEWTKLPNYEIPPDYIVIYDVCPKCGKDLTQ